MGRIALEGMEFYAHHGYYVEERKRGKNYLIDLFVESNIISSGASDDLDDTINYEILYTICKEEMDQAKHLIEAVAKSIADRIHVQYPQVKALEVKVKKLAPELGGPVDNAHVIYRIPEDL